MQIPLVKHAEAIGWEVVSPDASVAKRRGEAGFFHYPELEEALIRLNPGVVTSENLQSIIQQLEAVPNTMEGKPRVPRMAPRRAKRPRPEREAPAQHLAYRLREATFAIYWTLDEASVKDATGLATEIAGAFERFPNYSRNADELRQLKAEMYKVLLKEVSGKRMVEIGDRILDARKS